jgi:zinc/manganese transport system substrate-binding protein
MEQLRIFAATLLLFGAVIAPAAADPVPVVAAENFYGDVAHQIGGDNVAVASILSSPDQDPHLFEASPSIAKQLAGAKIVIFNGADYDPWVEKLLAAHKVPGRKEILVSALVHKKAGDNPHLWYEPATMKVFAKRLAADLSAIDAARKGDYEKGASTFIESLKGLDAKIAAMRKKYAGLPVTASEPVFGYMAQALGLAMRNEKFQLAVQNNTEPSVSEVAAFENDLKGHKVKIMLFNAQASEPAAQRLVKMAEEEKIPVVGVTETEPAGQTYQEWMLGQLDALDKALAGSTP